MGKLDDLLGIIRGVIESFSLPDHIADNNKVSVEVSLFKSEKPIIYNGPIIQVNAETPQGLEIAKRIFEDSEKLLDTGERIIESDFGKLIEGAKNYSGLSKGDAQFIEKVKPFVPPQDMPIIEASLFIRRLHNNGANVSGYKALLIQKYGSRGNNIANLITAGYYENYLAEIYKHLVETEADLAPKIFSEIYEEAVTQYPFAVFVSTTKTYEQIKGKIRDKIKLNLLNDQHVLNIHGIGKANKKTILALLADEDVSRFYLSEPDIVGLEKTIYIRIYF